MKKAVLFGSGQIGAMVSRLLGAEYEALCFADNYAPKWGQTHCGLVIRSPRDALKLMPDTVFICVLDGERSSQMIGQLHSLGYEGEILCPDALNIFDPRMATMRLLCRQIEEMNIPGELAELGVYRGAFAAGISAALPERTIHLFDTFEGFAVRDIETERTQRLSGAREGDFSDTSAELVLSSMPHPERAVVHRGFFPDTFSGCEELKFAFVSVDADLYAPTAAALPLFWERLSPGGAIMVHDVLSTQFTGAKKAVDEFCRERGIVPMPVCDLHGSVVLRSS